MRGRAHEEISRFEAASMVTNDAPLGALVNEVVTCDEAEPWSFGAGALIANLARRDLLRG